MRAWLAPGPPPGRHLGRLTERQRARRRLLVVVCRVALYLVVAALWGGMAAWIVAVADSAVWCSALVWRQVRRPGVVQDVFRVVRRR